MLSSGGSTRNCPYLSHKICVLACRLYPPSCQHETHHCYTRTVRRHAYKVQMPFFSSALVVFAVTLHQATMLIHSTRRPQRTGKYITKGTEIRSKRGRKILYILLLMSSESIRHGSWVISAVGTQSCVGFFQRTKSTPLTLWQ